MLWSLDSGARCAVVEERGEAAVGGRARAWRPSGENSARCRRLRIGDLLHSFSTATLPSSSTTILSGEASLSGFRPTRRGPRPEAARRKVMTGPMLVPVTTA